MPASGPAGSGAPVPSTEPVHAAHSKATRDRRATTAGTLHEPASRRKWRIELPSQDALERDVDPATYELDEGVDLVGCDREPARDLLPDFFREEVTGGGDPARRGRAMDAVELADLIAGRAFDERVAARGAFPFG